MSAARTLFRALTLAFIVVSGGQLSIDAAHAAAPAGSRPPVEAGMATELAAALERAGRHAGAPGLSMSVISAGGQQWSGAVGLNQAGEALTPEMSMAIGSVTKTFTAALVMSLVDEGRIKLDAPASTYLPRVALVRGVTVRQLLAHTSGIPDLYAPIRRRLSALPASTMSSNQVLTRISGRDFAPGRGYAYSNTNYFLLGHIIQDVTGRSFNDELAARFTGPLGMRHTRLLTKYDTLLPPAWSTGFWTSGAMISNPTELAHWGRALYGGGIISERSRQLMCEFDGSDQYGLGTQQLALGSRRVQGHSGLLYSTTSLLVFLPGERITVAITGTAANVDLDRALVSGYEGRPSLMHLISRLAGS